MDQQYEGYPDLESRSSSPERDHLSLLISTAEEFEHLGAEDDGDDDECDEDDACSRRERELALIDRQCFTILKYLQRCNGLRDGEYCLYQFRDKDGKRLDHQVSDALSLDAVMETSGYRAIRKFCWSQGLECILTEAFHPDYCYDGHTFVHLFCGPGYDSPVKSFQLVVSCPSD